METIVSRHQGTAGWGMKILILGVILTLIGFAITAIGVAAPSPTQPPPPGTDTSFGAVVFIGPFPLVFGSGPQSPLLILIGLMILALMLAIGLMSFRRRGF